MGNTEYSPAEEEGLMNARHGYMTEALKAVSKWALAQKGVTRAGFVPAGMVGKEGPRFPVRNGPKPDGRFAPHKRRWPFALVGRSGTREAGKCGNWQTAFYRQLPISAICIELFAGSGNQNRTETHFVRYLKRDKSLLRTKASRRAAESPVSVPVAATHYTRD